MANVKLSQEELALVSDAGFILTKNRIIGKVYDMFGILSDEFRSNSESFPSELKAIPPKISKGENYLGLPWVMMDYPRIFSKTDVFAVRCFFWWGNFFSITLQLAGRYQSAYGAAVSSYLAQRPSSNWWLSNAAEPWSHHFEPGNYRLYNAGDSVGEGGFIKLAKKIPLQQWDNAIDFYGKTFTEIREMSGA